MTIGQVTSGGENLSLETLTGIKSSFKASGVRLVGTLPGRAAEAIRTRALPVVDHIGDEVTSPMIARHSQANTKGWVRLRHKDSRVRPVEQMASSRRATRLTGNHVVNLQWRRSADDRL